MEAEKIPTYPSSGQEAEVEAEKIPTYPSSEPEAEVEDSRVLFPLRESLVRGDHVAQERLTKVTSINR